MQKTKIEWTDYVWNPIKGICPVGCWYCYARRIYERFKKPPELSWDGRVPILSNKKPSRIFVCSTIEMFHPQIPKEWRDTIFTIIEADYNKKHAFQILTKFPHLVDRPMPDNVWLGVTVDGEGNSIRNPFDLRKIVAKIRFVSIEPMLKFPGLFFDIGIDWVIMGRLTGYGEKYNPHKEWIDELVYEAKRYDLPIFLKDNLKEIWGEPLIQEVPK